MNNKSDYAHYTTDWLIVLVEKYTRRGPWKNNCKLNRNSISFQMSPSNSNSASCVSWIAATGDLNVTRIFLSLLATPWGCPVPHTLNDKIQKLNNKTPHADFFFFKHLLLSIFKITWYLMLIEYFVARRPSKCEYTSFQWHTAEVKERVSHTKSVDRGGSGEEIYYQIFLLNLKCTGLWHIVTYVMG